MLLLEESENGICRTFSPPQSQVAPLVHQVGEKFPIGQIYEALPSICWRVDLFNVDEKYTKAECFGNAHYEATVHGVTTNISARNSFDDYWDKRPKQLRHNIRRYLRKLNDDELNYTFVVRRSEEELLAAIERYGELESRGWKGRAGSAIHADNLQGAFIRKSFRRLARQAMHIF